MHYQLNPRWIRSQSQWTAINVFSYWVVSYERTMNGILWQSYCYSTVQLQSAIQPAQYILSWIMYYASHTSAHIKYTVSQYLHRYKPLWRLSAYVVQLSSSFNISNLHIFCPPVLVASRYFIQCVWAFM